MKRFLLATPLLLVVLLIISRPVLAAERTGIKGDPAVLCLPGVYLDVPGDCAPLGPSTYLTEMAQLGITFPSTPLPAAKPDLALTWVEYKYGKVRTPNARVYDSIEAAMKADKKATIRRIEANFSYISYTDEVVVDGRRFYMVDYGGWMTANDIARLGPSLFQGLVFYQTPNRAFAWVLTTVESKRTPGTDIEDYTGISHYRYEVVQIYDVKKVEDMEWYMIGPEEWIPEKTGWQRSVARVTPNTTPPKGIDGERWIEINLFEQTIAIYDQRQLVYASLVASGIEPFWTRPGLFQIFQRLDTTPMRGSFELDRSDAYYLEDVPWTMYFDQARALHGAYWHNGYGLARSKGCVNLSIGDARWIYDWAHEGDWVYVWDPSGRTPVDEELFTEGGA